MVKWWFVIRGDEKLLEKLDQSNRTCIASNTSPAGSASSDALPLQESIQSPDNSDSVKEVINMDVQSGHNGKNSIIATSNRTSTTSDTSFLGASPPAVVPYVHTLLIILFMLVVKPVLVYCILMYVVYSLR